MFTLEGGDAETPPKWLRFPCQAEGAEPGDRCGISINGQRNGSGASWSCERADQAGPIRAPNVHPSIRCGDRCHFHIQDGRFAYCEDHRGRRMTERDYAMADEKKPETEKKPEGDNKPQGQKGEPRAPQPGDKITMTREDLTALLARQKKDILDEIAAGGKVRQVDERETSRSETLANQALARQALNEPEDGKVPEGCVRFIPMRAFHVSRSDIPEYGDVDGASVEVIPDPEKPPIILKKKTAEALQARKFGRIV